MISTDIHYYLLNIYRNQAVHESTVKQWVAHFSRVTAPLVTSTDAGFYQNNMQLIAEKQCSVAKNLLYPFVLMCSLFWLLFPWKCTGGMTFRANYINTKLLCQSRGHTWISTSLFISSFKKNAETKCCSVPKASRRTV